MLAGDRIPSALNYQDWTAQPSAKLWGCLLVETGAKLRRDERFWARLQSPADAVLDRLGGVRLVEHLCEKELEEPLVVTQPIVTVVLRPPFLRVELLAPGVDFSSGYRSAERHGRAYEDRGLHPLGMLSGQDQCPLPPIDSETRAALSVPVASITANASAAMSTSS